jgi:hypothetical protein
MQPTDEVLRHRRAPDWDVRNGSIPCVAVECRRQMGSARWTTVCPLNSTRGGMVQASGAHARAYYTYKN